MITPVADEASARPVAPPAAPQLRFHLARHLKLLLILNILPLLTGLYLWWQYRQGRISLRKPISEESWLTLVVVVAAGAVFAATCWLVMPLARWLRDYPTWGFTHGNRLLWSLPLVGGWLTWLMLSATALIAAIACVVVAATGVMRLFELAS
jgi:hypothetical protein